MSGISSVTASSANSAQDVQPNVQVQGKVYSKHGKVHRGHHGSQGAQLASVTNPSANTTSQTVGTVLNKTV